MTTLRGAGATDVGRVRQVNEDRYLLSDGLFAVADGVGGHQAGEVASQTSVDTLAEAFKERTVEGLVTAIQEANSAVWQLAQEHAEKRGMGTTITALALVEQDGDDVLVLANVGDSRGYLFQLGNLEQVTEDHSLVEELVREGQLTPAEAQVHPQRSIITRALGMEPEIEVDAWTLTPYTGDRIVLCSDGLTNELSKDRIASILRQLADPEEAARELVRQARAHGGNDNITVVVVDVVDDGGRAKEASAVLAKEPTVSQSSPLGSSWSSAPKTAHGDSGAGSGRGTGGATATALRARPATAAPSGRGTDGEPRRFTWRVLLFLVLMACVLAVVAASIVWYGRGSYFVGLAGDQVAIYKGRPGGFLWFDPTLVERKPLTAEQVGPARIGEVRSGKELGSKAEADRYVNNLRQQAEERAAATSTTEPTTTTSMTTTVTPP